MIRVILAVLVTSILCNPMQDCLEDWHCDDGCLCDKEMELCVDGP